MNTPPNKFVPLDPASCTRRQFVNRSTVGLAAFALGSGVKPLLAQSVGTGAGDLAFKDDPAVFDLREFVQWIFREFEPSVRLPGGAGNYARSPGEKSPELYGVADMACILSTLGSLHPSPEARAEWGTAFQSFQDPKTGWLIERAPTHAPLHNTAFALAAMQLLDLAPAQPVVMDQQYRDVHAFLESLDWHTRVYPDSHKGAGLGSIYALVPALNSPAWFNDYFSTCDSLFDANNGLMGRGKPAGGDADQIGGTFHYHFLYQYFNRPMPFPEKRIDTVLGLQQADGYWHPQNHLWMTLDALYLMTRTLRTSPHRFAEVRRSARQTMRVLMNDVFSAQGRQATFVGTLAVHLLTAAISIAAEMQQFLGANEVLTERPLKLVLDRRPFI